MGDVGEVCGEVHRLLGLLPIYHLPGEVPFDNGLYFFYEVGEASPHAPDGRVVRVGNHPRSDDGLRRRLRLHYSGNKNSSVFRKLLGGALMRRADPSNPCLSHWEKHGAQVCDRCGPVEAEVSRFLRESFWFRCLEIRDRALRNGLEMRLIATLSLCPLCKPSESWLGRYAGSEAVRSSGLWNSRHVYNRSLTLKIQELKLLEELVEETRGKN